MLTQYAAVSRGLGQHLYVFGPEGAKHVVQEYLKVLFVFQLFFNLATGFTKLAMYVEARIFPSMDLF